MTYTPPTRPSLKIVKSMPYRGGTQLWSNRYFVTGADPSDAEFLALFNAVTADEKQCLSSRCTIVEGVGYHAGSDVPVWTHSASIACTMVPSSANFTNPGDCAAVVRFGTTQRTTKNHPIYLFKYYHDAYSHGATVPDQLEAGQKADLESYTNDWLTGFSDGTNVRQLCGPFGAVAQSRVVNGYITHRDFPR